MTERDIGRQAPRSSRLGPADLLAMARNGRRIVSVTAYDHPSGRLADEASVDIILVGDSAAMTMLGHASTRPITMDEMVTFTGAVSRAVSRAMVVADMPFGSFQPSNDVAVANARRFAREAGADAVKIEGAGPSLERARAIIASGVPVMGHVGLTPQSIDTPEGYKAQGRTASAARTILADAVALERAGCFAVVLEAMPPPVASAISNALEVPTIGIGAGSLCDGQVLVWHDLLGLSPGRVARFVKRYADLGAAISDALRHYAADVRDGRYPDESHTYTMDEAEAKAFDPR